MALSSHAFALDVQERQCQNTLLLRLGSLKDGLLNNLFFRKSSGLECTLFGGQLSGPLFLMLITALLVFALAKRPCFSFTVPFIRKDYVYRKL